jgi:hypothetical protein
MQANHEAIILNALWHAETTFRTDANTCFMNGNARLAEQFKKQAKEAAELAALIENGQPI